MGICGFAVGFIFSWKLSLVIIAISPILIVSSAAFMMVKLFCQTHKYLLLEFCLTFYEILLN